MELIISIIIGAIVAYVGVRLFSKRKSDQRGLKTIPGPCQLPLIGNTHQINKTKLHLDLYKWAHTYGDIYQFKILGINYVMLNSEEIIDSALATFIKRPFNINGLLNFNGKGITFIDDKFIVNETKLAMIDAANSTAIQALCDKELEKLVTKLKADGDTELNTVIKATVCRNVLIYCLGCNPGDIEQTLTLVYLGKAVELFDGPAAILTALPWLRFIPGPFKNVYNANKTTKMDMVKCLMGKSLGPDVMGVGLVQHLMARKQSLGESGTDASLQDENIYAILVDALLGSIIPMSAVLTSTLLCILTHSDVQESIHKELDRACANKPPSYPDRERLPYLRATILEGFRYISVLTTTVPHTVKEDTEFNGYLIEKDSQIFGNLCNLHHNDAIWADSWTFRPDRFLNNDGQLLPGDHPYRKSVKLFGTGPRMCKGYPFAVPLIFNTIATIMHHFKMTAPTEGELPNSDPRTYGYGAALAIPNVCCRFEPRL